MIKKNSAIIDGNESTLIHIFHNLAGLQEALKKNQGEKKLDELILLS
jgi:hypothetical protein